MIMYKALLKLIAKERVSMIISLVITLIPVLAILSSAPSEGETQFEMVNMELAVMNESDSEVANHMIDNFSEENNVHLSDSDSEQDLRQKLYIGLYDAIIKIPADFEERLTEGTSEVVEIESNLFPETAYLSYALVQKYLLYADTILSASADVTFSEATAQVTDTLAVETEVAFLDEKTTNSGISVYYSAIAFLAWFLMQTILTMLGSVMLTVKEEKVFTRIQLGGLSNVNQTLQIFLAQLTFGVLLLGITLGILRFYVPNSIDIDWIHYGGTFAVFIFTCLGLTYLLTEVVSNRYIYSAVSLVITLGLSFISGIFIPYDFMSDVLKRLADFSPVYYYYRAITKDISHYTELFSEWGIMFAFGVVFILLGLVFTRQKRELKQ